MSADSASGADLRRAEIGAGEGLIERALTHDIERVPKRRWGVAVLGYSMRERLVRSNAPTCVGAGELFAKRGVAVFIVHGARRQANDARVSIERAKALADDLKRARHAALRGCLHQPDPRHPRAELRGQRADFEFWEVSPGDPTTPPTVDTHAC